MNEKQMTRAEQESQSAAKANEQAPRRGLKILSRVRAGAASADAAAQADDGDPDGITPRTVFFCSAMCL